MADDALKDLPTALIENYVLLNAALEQQNTGKFESMLSYQEKLHDNIQRIMQGLEVAPSLAVVMPGSAQQPDGSAAAPAVRWLLSPPLLPPTPAAAMAPPAAPPPPPAAAAAAAAAAGAGASIGTGGATPPAMHAAQQAPDAFHTAAGGLVPSPYTMGALAGAAPDQQQQQQVEEDSLQLHQQHRRSSGTGSHASGVGPGPGAASDRLPGMMGHAATLTSSAAAAPAANPQLMQLQGYALQQQQAWQGPALAAGGAGGVVAHNQAMQQLPGTGVFGTSQPGPPGLSLGGTPLPAPGAMLGGAPHSSDWLAVVNTSVAGFLQLLGLERFEPLLQENGVDMAALQLMTEQHLKDLGLPIGAVVKIRAALARPGV